MSVDIKQNLELIAKGAVAEQATEYFKDALNRQWDDAITQAVSAANKRDADAALAAVMQIASVRKLASQIRYDIAQAKTAEELIRFRADTNAGSD